MWKKFVWVPPIFVGVLLFTMIGKVWHMENVAVETIGIGFVPLSIRVYLPMLLPLSEIVLVALIVTPPTRWVGMALGTVMLVAFTVYLIWKWYNPNGTGCLCSGGLIPLELPLQVEIALGILRNVTLIVLNGYWLVVTSLGQREYGDSYAEEAGKEGVHAR